MDENIPRENAGKRGNGLGSDAESDALGQSYIDEGGFGPLAQALALIPGGERASFIQHIQRLARMKAGKRGAIYTLSE